MEGVAGPAAVGDRVDESVDHLGELQHRAGPAVGDDHRQGVVMGRADVLEMDVEAVDGREEVGSGVDGSLTAAPVVGVGPVLAHLPHIGEGDPLGPVAHHLGLGPASTGQPITEVVDLGVGDCDGEGADLCAHGPHRRQVASRRRPEAVQPLAKRPTGFPRW